MESPLKLTKPEKEVVENLTKYRSLKFAVAIAYVNEVKNVFRKIGQDHKYRLFLHILKEFRANRTDIEGVKVLMEALLKGHGNLIVGFNIFLPSHCEKIKIVESHKPLSFVNKMKKFVKKMKLR